jgi:hypothetical protein
MRACDIPLAHLFLLSPRTGSRYAMRLTLSLVGVLAQLLLCEALRAQGVNGPQRAYEVLPTGDVTPPSDAELTIVPPMQVPPSVSGATLEAQPWTPSGAVYPQNVPLSHAISAEPWDGGWFGSVELTILRPYFDDLPIADRHTSVGPRLTLGWESDRGLGLRARFWGLENETTLLGPLGATAEYDLNAFRFDMDFYREFDFRGSSVIVGASITAAELEAEIDATGLANDAGGGVGLFIEGRHLLSRSPDSEWSLLARGRWAGLVGAWEDPNSGLFATEGDSNLKIVEAGLGWEYKRKFDSCSLVLQHAIELQTWQASYIQDLSFFGQTVSLGFDF